MARAFLEWLGWTLNKGGFMKKLFLIIILILAIFQLVVLATAIDVGGNTGSTSTHSHGNLTWVDLTNPADYSGKITDVYIYPAISMASAKVIFVYRVDATNYTVRSVSGNLGTVASGGNRQFTVDLNVVAGDFIGIYFTDNGDAICTNESSGDGLGYWSGDGTTKSNATFNNFYAGRSMAIYGTGTATEVEETNIFMGVNF
jgi:hypothetical protein